MISTKNINNIEIHMYLLNGKQNKCCSFHYDEYDPLQLSNYRKRSFHLIKNQVILSLFCEKLEYGTLRKNILYKM